MNAITDVAGVRVGHTTIVRGDGPLRVGEGPVRTGVTVILPHDGVLEDEPLYAGYHWLNGNGEITGTAWIHDGGMLTTLIGLTNTHSVGVVRDALIDLERRGRGYGSWGLPVVGETWDGVLNDIDGAHVTAAHVREAYEAAARSGPGEAVAEGSVGGGTGMICHGFKGGIGTSSRVVEGGWTVGVLLQANHGLRERLTVDGVPVRIDDVPPPGPPHDRGSGLGDRDRGDRRAAAPAPVPAAGPAGRAGHCPYGRRRGELQRRRLPGVLHRQPRPSYPPTRPAPGRRRSSRSTCWPTPTSRRSFTV